MEHSYRKDIAALLAEKKLKNYLKYGRTTILMNGILWFLKSSKRSFKKDWDSFHPLLQKTNANNYYYR
jgi:hypothetical protein